MDYPLHHRKIDTNGPAEHRRPHAESAGKNFFYTVEHFRKSVYDSNRVFSKR